MRLHATSRFEAGMTDHISMTEALSPTSVGEWLDPYSFQHPWFLQH
jgi:hypothetical protein